MTKIVVISCARGQAIKREIMRRDKTVQVRPPHVNEARVLYNKKKTYNIRDCSYHKRNNIAAISPAAHNKRINECPFVVVVVRI